jgi:hypothetical protein
MAKEKIEQQGNEVTNDVEDLTLNEPETEQVKGGATIRVHYDTGYGNRISIRGSGE